MAEPKSLSIGKIAEAVNASVKKANVGPHRPLLPHFDPHRGLFSAEALARLCDPQAEH